MRRQKCKGLPEHVLKTELYCVQTLATYTYSSEYKIIHSKEKEREKKNDKDGMPLVVVCRGDRLHSPNGCFMLRCMKLVPQDISLYLAEWWCTSEINLIMQMLCFTCEILRLGSCICILHPFMGEYKDVLLRVYRVYAPATN